MAVVFSDAAPTISPMNRQISRAYFLVAGWQTRITYSCFLTWQLTKLPDDVVDTKTQRWGTANVPVLATTATFAMPVIADFPAWVNGTSYTGLLSQVTYGGFYWLCQVSTSSAVPGADGHWFQAFNRARVHCTLVDDSTTPQSWALREEYYFTQLQYQTQ